MANLGATTAPSLSATSVSAPQTIANVGLAMSEYIGQYYLANNQAIDVIGHNSNYARMPGTCHFFAESTSMSNWFGMFDFQISLYGLVYTPIIISDWGSYTVAAYSESFSNNYVRFTNTSGYPATFYFSFVVLNMATIVNSMPLTKIK